MSEDKRDSFKYEHFEDDDAGNCPGCRGSGDWSPGPWIGLAVCVVFVVLSVMYIVHFTKSQTRKEMRPRLHHVASISFDDGVAMPSRDGWEVLQSTSTDGYLLMNPFSNLGVALLGISVYERSFESLGLPAGSPTDLTMGEKLQEWYSPESNREIRTFRPGQFAAISINGREWGEYTMQTIKTRNGQRLNVKYLFTPVSNRVLVVSYSYFMSDEAGGREKARIDSALNELQQWLGTIVFPSAPQMKEGDGIR